MKLTSRVYDVFIPGKGAGKVGEIGFNLQMALTLSTPHSREPGDLGPQNMHVVHMGLCTCIQFTRA